MKDQEQFSQIQVQLANSIAIKFTEVAAQVKDMKLEGGLCPIKETISTIFDVFAATAITYKKKDLPSEQELYKMLTDAWESIIGTEGESFGVSPTI